VPGCPPRPEQIIDGVMNIHELVKKESNRRRYSEEYKHLMDTYQIDIDQHGEAK
jgi:NADH-quinone oxidoreductase subunit B